MKSLAIVSSYSDSCGNAYFTKVLVESISRQGVKAGCEELDLKLTQSIDGLTRRLADRHINQLADRLKGYDAVNIQLEAGLFGSLPVDIKRRVKTLASANANVSVTLHSPRLTRDAIGRRRVIKTLLTGKVWSALRDYLAMKSREIHIEINIDLIRWLCRKNIRLIVHTQRAKDQIASFFGYGNVVVHPLQIVPEDFSSQPEAFAAIKRIAGLGADDIVIGMFGFINEYKGHTLALEALEQLPANYKLMIFGRQHPQTLVTGQLCHPYLKELQARVKNTKSLSERVFFMGEYDTPEFMNFASCVDVSWLPYVENGQDGSGIASICVEVGKRVLCSSSFAFDELFRLGKYSNVYRFDIGNAIELAQKTRMAMNDERLGQAASMSPYSLATQAQAYTSDVRQTLGGRE